MVRRFIAKICALVVLILVCFSTLAAGQTSEGFVRSELYKVRLPFAFDYPYLDYNFRDVKSRTENLLAEVNRLGYENIDSIEIHSYASPQGGYEHNLWLSEERRLSLKFLFISNWGLDIKPKLVYHNIGESWDLLREDIEADEKLTEEQKAQAVRIITSGDSSAARKAAMEALPFYQYLYENHYSNVRGGTVVLVKYVPAPADEPAPVEQVAKPAEEIVPIEVEVEPAVEEEPVVEQEQQAAAPVEAEKRPLNFGAPVFALKSNLLTDVAAVPGIGIEFGLGKHFSAVANFQGAWWSSERKNFFWQAITGDVAVRWWLKEHFTGHHVGIYGQAVTFDFELGQRGYQLKRPGYGAGIEYGWAMPLGRKNNGLSLDFEVGVGYISGDMYEYEPDFGHYVWQQTTRFRWFGPTKAGVTLIWAPQLGGKGGKR